MTLHEAKQASPSLAKLTQQSQVSVERLAALQPLIPKPLQSSLSAGPIVDSVWCLIVNGNAAAAKIRQILPSLVIHLKKNGHDVSSIRLRVQTSRN